MAGTKIVIMPYGGDVQDLLRTQNLLFRHAMGIDYPGQRKTRGVVSKKIDLWCQHADHVISGCDWVEYMHFWHTLMIAHFSIDLNNWKPSDVPNKNEEDRGRPFRVLHAPNHKAVKGTEFIVKAVEELQAEGESVELVLAQKLPNEEVKRLIQSVDLVADQLVIGWYAMFAIEAMALGKPVLCYLRKDLELLYINSGLLQHNEIPLISCGPPNVKDTIRGLMHNSSRLIDAGNQGPEYVKKHHSLESVGSVFDHINKGLGLIPRASTETIP